MCIRDSAHSSRGYSFLEKYCFNNQRPNSRQRRRPLRVILVAIQAKHWARGTLIRAHHVSILIALARFDALVDGIIRIVIFDGKVSSRRSSYYVREASWTTQEPQHYFR